MNQSNVKVFFKNPWFIAVVVGVLFITLMRPMTRYIPDPPERLYPLPNYTFTNQEGEPFGSQNLAGSVYIVHLFFTKCPSVCPLSTKAVATLQEKFTHSEIPIKLVSISVDPENDTSEVMKEYALKYKADFSRWTFLTGELPQLRDFIFSGLKLEHGDRVEMGVNLYDITHASKLTLVDDENFVRGYYGTDETGIDEIFNRSQHVLREASGRKHSQN